MRSDGDFMKKKKIQKRPMPIRQRLTDNTGRQVAVSAAAATAQWCHPGRPQFSDPTGAMNTTADVEPSRGPVKDVIKRLTTSRGIGSLVPLSSSSSFAFTVSWATCSGTWSKVVCLHSSVGRSPLCHKSAVLLDRRANGGHRWRDLRAGHRGG